MVGTGHDYLLQRNGGRREREAKEKEPAEWQEQRKLQHRELRECSRQVVVARWGGEGGGGGWTGGSSETALRT